MDRLGHRVVRLIRISYGPFQLGGLSEDGIDQLNQGFWLTSWASRTVSQAVQMVPANSEAKQNLKTTGVELAGQQPQRGQNAGHRRPTSRRKTGRPRR